MNEAFFYLLLFCFICSALFVVYRPKSGFYWNYKRNQNTTQKTIIEDILKLLFHREDKGIASNFLSLSKSMHYPDKKILSSLNEMEKQNLVTITSQNIRLTDTGESYALRVIRVHRLYEKYLSEHTGYSKIDWHDKAEIMEHRLSQSEVDKLALELGYPLYDPHGDPIPDENGEIGNQKTISLTELEENDKATIVHIEDEPTIVYQQILAEKIHIGSQIRVLQKDKSRIIFYSEGEEYVLAPVIADNINVVKLENDLDILDTQRLSSIEEGKTYEIISISNESRGLSRRRLLDLGMVKGSQIKIDMKSPLGDPIAYKIKGTSIALRNDQADHILVKISKNK